MYIGKQGIEIECSRSTVFRVAKSYPTFVRFFLEGSRILAEDNDTLYVEVHSRLLGLKTSWRGEGKKIPEKAIRFTQTKGLFRGLVARWSFIEKSPSLTKVRICTAFDKGFLTSFGERVLGKHLVERVTAKLLSELKFKSELSNSGERKD